LASVVSAHSPRSSTLESDFAVGLHSRDVPSRRAVESLGARGGSGCEPDLLGSPLEKPHDGAIVKLPPEAAPFEVRMHEERPNVPCVEIGYRKTDDTPLRLPHSPMPTVFEHLAIRGECDAAGRCENVFTHRGADGMHRRDVVA